MVDENAELIEALAKNEEKIAVLYRKYGERFADHKEFWNRLAGEEMGHAEQLRTLLKLGSAKLYVKERFNIVAVNNFSKHVLAESDPVKVCQASLINALSIALSFEQSLIESKYFEVFETDSLQLKKVLSNIGAETRRHLVEVREFWIKAGGR